MTDYRFKPLIFNRKRVKGYSHLNINMRDEVRVSYTRFRSLPYHSTKQDRGRFKHNFRKFYGIVLKNSDIRVTDMGLYITSPILKTRKKKTVQNTILPLVHPICKNTLV